MAKAEYRSAIRSRKLINTALADLLQEKPLDKITVTDVVNRAQINRGTFYAHYSDIPDVIKHIIDQMFSQIQAALQDADQAVADLPKALLSRVQAFLEEDLDFYRKIMSSSAASMMQERLVSIALEYMAQREPELGFGDHEQYMLVTRFCAGGLSNLYWDWFSGEIPLSLDDLTRRAEELLRAFMVGMGIRRKPPEGKDPK